MARGILYLFATITYSRKNDRDYGPVVEDDDKSGAEAPLCSCKNDNLRKFYLTSCLQKENLEQPSSSPLRQHQKPNPIWILVPWGER